MNNQWPKGSKHTGQTVKPYNPQKHNGQNYCTTQKTFNKMGCPTNPGPAKNYCLSNADKKYNECMKKYK